MKQEEAINEYKQIVSKMSNEQMILKSLHDILLCLRDPGKFSSILVDELFKRANPNYKKETK